MDEKAIQAIERILKRGNTAQVQRKKDGYIILEVKKEIKYAAQAGADESNES